MIEVHDVFLSNTFLYVFLKEWRSENIIFAISLDERNHDLSWFSFFDENQVTGIFCSIGTSFWVEIVNVFDLSC